MPDVNITPSEDGPVHRVRADDPHGAGRARDRAPRPDGDVPLRRFLEQAVLRRHARHDRLRRNARELIGGYTTHWSVT